MTRYRLITLLTILMLALSLAIAGAWVWAQRQPAALMYSSSGGFGIPFYQHQDALWPESKLNEIPNTHLVPLTGTIGVEYRVRPKGTTRITGTRLVLLPIRYEESITFSEWRPRELEHYHKIQQVLTPTDEQILAYATEIFLLEHGNVLPRDAQQVIIGNAIARGPGTRTRLYWPGVAQRVRIWSPRALILTGSLTLLGFVTLAVQRRRLRNRLRTGHCPNCAYDLRGLASPTNCPECGHALPPSPLEGEGGREATG